MERNLVSIGTMPADNAAKLRAQMERFFPEAMVTGYEPLVAVMQNDAKDRHVVAAAVKAGAQVVTTSNLKDFTPLPGGIEAQSPDDFLCNLFDLDPAGFVEMLREQAADLQKPPVTFEQLLDRLARAVPELVRGPRTARGARPRLSAVCRSPWGRAPAASSRWTSANEHSLHRLISRCVTRFVSSPSTEGCSEELRAVLGCHSPVSESRHALRSWSSPRARGGELNAP